MKAVEKPKKPYLSPTQIEMFTGCGEAYRRRYIEGDKIPPGIALVKGTAVHIGAALNFEQKIESFEDLRPSEIIDASVAALEGRGKVEGLLLTDDEKAIGKAKVFGECKDSTVRLAGLFSREVAPHYQPKYVEKSVTIPLPNSSHDLKGILDLVSVDEELVDLKTGKKKKNQKDWDDSPQLTTYALTKKHLDGKLPKKILIEQLVDSGKSEPKRHLFETTRSMPDFKALGHRMNAVIKGITSGVFVPAPAGYWKCSPVYCGYWRSCSYVNSERKAAVKPANI